MDLARIDAVPPLAELPFDDRAALAGVACEARAFDGEVLVRDGDFRYEFIAIESGEADVFRDGELVARLTAGDVVGEIGALERHVGTVTVVARSAMQLVTITALDLRRLRRNAPAAVARMQAMLLRRRLRVAG